jgi:hypothetical protein
MKPEQIAAVIVKKTVGKKLANMPLAKQCQLIVNAINMPQSLGGGIINTRANLLKGLPDDIRDFRDKQGMTEQEIIDYYWNKPEFQKVWSMLELTKDSLEILVKGEFHGIQD